MGHPHDFADSADIRSFGLKHASRGERQGESPSSNPRTGTQKGARKPRMRLIAPGLVTAPPTG